MERWMLLLLLLLVAGCCANAQKAPSQKTVDVGKKLRELGYTSFLQIARAANATDPSEDAVLTIFVPTNKAVAEFMERMNITLDGIQQRPTTAAAILAYHILPRVKGDKNTVRGFTQERPLVGLAADNAHQLKFWVREADGRSVIEDTQGSIANFVAEGVDVGKNVVLYGIDRVLMGGDVFYSMADLLEKHPQFKPMRAVFEKTGVYQELRAMTGTTANSFTVFVPTADALKAAEPALAKLSNSQLKDVLRYHVLPFPISIPGRIMQFGVDYETVFKGHYFQFKREYVPRSARTFNPRAPNATSTPGSRAGELASKVPVVGIVPEDGIFGGVLPADVQNPTVTIDNLFANRIVVHGINAVLRPDLSGKKQQQAPAAKPAGAAASSSKPQAASGRKLLQFRQGLTGSVLSAGMSSTQSAIRDAVEGRTDASFAALSGSSAARAGAARCWNCVSDIGA